MVDDDDIDIQRLQFSNSTNVDTSITITGLNDSSCYIFGVRAYTDNGYGEWTVIANETLELPPLPSLNSTSASTLIYVIVSVTVISIFILLLIPVIIAVVMVIKMRLKAKDKVIITDNKPEKSK
ncbi:PREDICTED: ephrin type-A receptor 4-A-like, partial [Amphimedon queenslandica]